MQKWRDMSEYKPDDFELVQIKLTSGRVRSGWWTGQAWDSAIRIAKGSVEAWRPIYQPRVPRARSE